MREPYCGAAGTVAVATLVAPLTDWVLRVGPGPIATWSGAFRLTDPIAPIVFEEGVVTLVLFDDEHPAAGWSGAATMHPGESGEPSGFVRFEGVGDLARTRRPAG